MSLQVVNLRPFLPPSFMIQPTAYVGSDTITTSNIFSTGRYSVLLLEGNLVLTFAASAFLSTFTHPVISTPLYKLQSIVDKVSANSSWPHFLAGCEREWMSETNIFMRLTFARILLGFTLASFVPQYKRIRDRTDSDGISLSYVLLNLIVATQQFSLYLLFVIDDSTVADFLVKSPPSIENYLDLAQFGIVWLCQLVL